MEIMFSCDRDIRDTDPNKDQRRKARFLVGWKDAEATALDPKKQYNEATLKELTWQNLGFCLGSFFGRATDRQINKLFDWCVEQQPAQASRILSRTSKQPSEST